VLDSIDRGLVGMGSTLSSAPRPVPESIGREEAFRRFEEIEPAPLSPLQRESGLPPPDIRGLGPVEEIREPLPSSRQQSSSLLSPSSAFAGEPGRSPMVDIMLQAGSRTTEPDLSTAPPDSRSARQQRIDALKLGAASLPLLPLNIAEAAFGLSQSGEPATLQQPEEPLPNPVTPVRQAAEEALGLPEPVTD